MNYVQRLEGNSCRNNSPSVAYRASAANYRITRNQGNNLRYTLCNCNLFKSKLRLHLV